MGGEWVVVLCVGEWWYVADGGLTRRWWWYWCRDVVVVWRCGEVVVVVYGEVGDWGCGWWWCVVVWDASG